MPRSTSRSPARSTRPPCACPTRRRRTCLARGECRPAVWRERIARRAGPSAGPSSRGRAWATSRGSLCRAPARRRRRPGVRRRGGSRGRGRRDPQAERRFRRLRHDGRRVAAADGEDADDGDRDESPGSHHSPLRGHGSGLVFAATADDRSLPWSVVDRVPTGGRFCFRGLRLGRVRRRWVRAAPRSAPVNGHVKVPTRGHEKSPPDGVLRLAGSASLLSSSPPSSGRSRPT